MTLIHSRSFACAVMALSLAGCDTAETAQVPEERMPQATAPALVAAAPHQAQQAAAPAQPPPLTREQRRVKLLIEQVESAYARGEADYRKGQLRDAKVQFDLAVDLMLMSGIDIKGNSELHD